MKPSTSVPLFLPFHGICGNLGKMLKILAFIISAAREENTFITSFCIVYAILSNTSCSTSHSGLNSPKLLLLASFHHYFLSVSNKMALRTTPNLLYYCFFWLGRVKTQVSWPKPYTLKAKPLTTPGSNKTPSCSLSSSKKKLMFFPFFVG